MDPAPADPAKRCTHADHHAPVAVCSAHRLGLGLGFVTIRNEYLRSADCEKKELPI